MRTIIRAVVIVLGLALFLGAWEAATVPDAAPPNAVEAGMIFGGIVLIAIGLVR